MEKELDSILKILEKATTTEDVIELNQIEENLQYYIKIINKSSNSNNLLSKSNEISNRLEKLRNLINKLESNKNLNNELFLEFKQFIENRKFK
tara:strand:+ start:71 stop:349 length:279 start_codon:yes stop_codon:yes gene_type:complete